MLLATGSRQFPLLNLAIVAFAGAHGGVTWAGVLAYGNRDWRSPVEGRAARDRDSGRKCQPPGMG